MSYLNQTHDPRRRATAIAATVAVHAALGVAVVTGLTVAGYKTIDTYDPIVQFPTPPLPPEPTPTETPKQRDEVTYIPPEPRPPIDTTRDTAPTRETLETDRTDVTLFPGTGATEFPPAPPPTPAPSFTPKRAVPSNNTAGWITTDDYPRRELVDGREGSVGYRLVIGTNGRVSSCELTSPSGIRGLDSATCRLIASRARFEPATDETGAKVLGTFTGSVRWDIPE